MAEPTYAQQIAVKYLQQEHDQEVVRLEKEFDREATMWEYSIGSPAYNNLRNKYNHLIGVKNMWLDQQIDLVIRSEESRLGFVIDWGEGYSDHVFSTLQSAREYAKVEEGMGKPLHKRIVTIVLDHPYGEVKSIT